MLLAYCRGLLKPDYKHGLQSILREKLVLHALACEAEAQSTETILSNEAAWYATHVDIQRAEDYIRNTERLLKYAAERRLLSAQSYESMFGALRNDIVNLVEMYKQAEAAGIIDRFKEMVDSSN